MTKRLVTRGALTDFVAALAQAVRPGGRGAVLEADQWRVVQLPDVECGSRVAAQYPARRRDRVTGLLPEDKHPDQQLEEDLRLCVRAHGADDAVRLPRQTRHHERRQGVRRSAARAVLRRMAGDERESHAAVVQENPALREHDAGTEVRGVGHDQRHAHPVPVDHTEVGGPTVAVHIAKPPAGFISDGRGPGSEPARPDQRSPVRVLVEHLRPVIRRLTGRLDQQERPALVAGIGRETDLIGDPGARQRQVTLGVRRDCPEPTAQCSDRQRPHPVCPRGPQVTGAELAAAGVDELPAEGTAVEAAGPIGGDLLESTGNARKD